MDGSIAATQFGSTLLAVGGMQWLKNSKWFPLIKSGQTTINRIWSAAVAAGVVIGIHAVWSPAASDGSHTLTVLIPSFWTIVVGLFHWASQFIYQETGYQVMNGLQSIGSLVKTLTAAQTGK